MKYRDMVDWGTISAYQELSEEFIEKFKKNVIWYIISQHQKLSEEFLIRHINSIHIYLDRIVFEYIYINSNTNQ
jgi:hypothetical protein